MCEPVKGASLAAAGLTVVLAYEVLDSFAEAIALGVGAACAVSAAILVHSLCPGLLARLAGAVWRRVYIPARVGVNIRALAAPPRELEAPRQVVHVITDARERIGR